jgi:hypothetical protein
MGMSGPLNSQKAVSDRLLAQGVLSGEELRAMLPHARTLTASQIIPLQGELAIQTLIAIESFDRSSRKLNSRLIWLTVVLAVLSLVTAWPILRSTFFCIHFHIR